MTKPTRGRTAAVTGACVASLLLTAGTAASASVSAAPSTAAAAAADESPRITDKATLLGGQVVNQGRRANIDFRLTCPKGRRWSAEMLMVTVGAQDDVFARTSRARPPRGTCSGRAKKVTLALATQGPDALQRNCSAEYGVKFRGRHWVVEFDRGGADGGPDGPGPRLCLK